MRTAINAKHLILFAVLALVGGVFGGYLAERGAISNRVLPDSSKMSYLEESTITDAADRVVPAVLTIVATRDLPLYQDRTFNFDDHYYEDLIFGNSEENGAGNQLGGGKVSGGSGVIISSDGLALTNYHVVDNPELEYSVIMNNGESLKVAEIKADQIHDIALLRLTDANGDNPHSLPFAVLGDSDTLQVGQYVIAIGNALARFSNSVTTGVISALGRSITADDFAGSANLLNLIQTDASIHPGNSGGPLINLKGEVIGINTAIATNASGIGFAVPSNDIRSLPDEMEAGLN